MSYYVHRIHDDGRNGWIGPIRSPWQARREVDAWKSAGWNAWSHESSAEVKAMVKAWQRQVKARKAR